MKRQRLGTGTLLLALLLLAASVSAFAETASAPATLVPPSQGLITPTPAPTAQRDLTVGDRGDDVYLLKTRMQKLGYFHAETSLSSIFTETSLEHLNQLLTDNGMEPVEIATVEIQNMILSRDDLAVDFTPTPTPQPLIAPQGTPELPELDAEGFLADAEGEYVYADADDGLWYYISGTLYINIRRYNDLEEHNVWCEAEVKTRGGEGLRSFFVSKREGHQTPVEIARANSAVLAFNDDYFLYRKYGVAIRDREVYRDTVLASDDAYPLGDTLAVFADGSMKTFAKNAYSAQEYLDMGAVQVFAFGPILVQNGEMGERIQDPTYYHYREPRCALGMIEPNHYMVLTVSGRTDTSKGAYLTWLAERMIFLGVTEALNLDGGGTTSLVFMGERVYADCSGTTSVRDVSSIIGFGQYTQAGQ